MSRALLAASATLALSCGAAAPSASGTAPRRAPTLTPSATSDGALPRLPPTRVALGSVEKAPLEISAILPVWGDETAVFVSGFANEAATYFQRVDGASGGLGPIVSLANEQVFAAFARGDALTIASSRGDAICLTTYRGADATTRGCEVKTGTVLLPLGEGFVVLSASPVDPEAKAERADQARPTAEPRAPAAPRPKPDRRGKPKPTKRRPRAKIEAKIAADPRKLSIDRQLVHADGTLDGELEPTGLEIVAPLAGMDLVAGTSNGGRARALYYEWVGSVKNAKTGVLGKARLALGSLDETGRYDDASRSQLSDADLMFGYLAEHQEPRLLTTSRGALYLGVSSSRGKCEATVVSPFSMPLIPDDGICAIDPRAFFGIAEAVRAAQKAGTPVGRAGFPTPLVASPALATARRVYAQNDWDPVRTAAWGTRGYAMSGDDAYTFTAPDHADRLARPLVAERSRLRWGAFAPDGSGIAEVDGALVRVDAAGGVSSEPLADGAAIPLRADELVVARRRAVKIGTSWFDGRGTHRAIGASGAPKGVPAEGSILVGGAESGLLVEIGSGTLRVARFDPATSTSTTLATGRAPVGVGFDAVERAAGGAIVAGTDERGHVLAFALDARGAASTPVDTGLTPDPARRAVRLVPLPRGGALVSDLDRREVAWLDDGGQLRAKAAWPPGASDARCVDGRAAPTEVPSTEPGRFVHVPELAAPNTCVSGDLAWANDGSLRWFGSTASGPHTRAELGRVPRSAEDAAPPPAEVTKLAPLEPRPPSPCPPDMVSIAGRYCVDRFEDTLLDTSSGALVSPDVATTASLRAIAMGEWSTRRERVGDLFARALPLPFVDPRQWGRDLVVAAVSRQGVRPSGYVTGVVARAACEGAGKRLCTLDEWRTACRGEADRLFPYGADYEDRACNVNREAHPAALLHGHSSLGHLDPRLNHVAAAGAPLFHATGASPRCVSRWGDDGVFDMVGNVDEWVDEGAGAFAGGFYARGTKSGCGALVDNHPASYLDYSTGVRCCRDAAPAPMGG